MTELETKVNRIKKSILKMFYHSGTGHLASAFSCVEILATLYNQKKADDDIILSKGHGAAALYAVLAEEGIIDKNLLKTFYDSHSKLLALASPTVDGIYVPTGSLGQGICFAAGMAKAIKYDNGNGKVYCVIGDGEMQEGSVWEAAMFAGVHKLGNLCVVLDNNHIQAGHRIKAVSDDEGVLEKWKAFHWVTYEVDGHNSSELENLIKKIGYSDHASPTIIIADTIKGNGLPGIENRDDCHMKNPKEEDWKYLCKIFGISEGEMMEYAK